jgi:DNA-binding MarR family transcriptional regulator
MAILSRHLDQQASALLKDKPVNLSSYRFLRTVDTFEQISIADVSRFIAMDRALASRTAMELERSGFVTFRKDPGNKRTKLVVMTETGKKLVDEILPRFRERTERIENRLGEELLGSLALCLDLLEETVSE